METILCKTRLARYSSRIEPIESVVGIQVQRRPLQQHLRLNVGDLTTFDDVLEIVKI